MQQVRPLQLVQIAVDRLHIQLALLTFQVFGYGQRRKRLPHVVQRVFDHALQLVHFANLIALYNVRKNGGVINVPDNRVCFFLRKVLYMHRREPTIAQVAGKFRIPVAHRAVGFAKLQVFRKP